jgi:hypothetical protein
MPAEQRLFEIPSFQEIPRNCTVTPLLTGWSLVRIRPGEPRKSKI